MRSKIASLFTVAILLINVFAIKTQTGDRVINGLSAEPGQFPFIVSIRDWYGNHHCGGVIVHEFLILTTALCVHGSNKDYFTIVAGSNILESGGTPYRIASIKIHPEYKSQNTENDIAILLVTAPIRFNEFVQTIQMRSSEIKTNITAVFAGWGSTACPGLVSSNELKYLSVQIMDITLCQKEHNPDPIYNSSQLCTFSKNRNGPHRGDAGGPLVYNNTLIGLISWGKPCSKGYPDVHTKISHFFQWITQEMYLLNVL